MAEIYDIVSVVAFVLAAIMIAAAIILWFKFDIYRIAGDLSGRTAKKTIADMRRKNEKNTQNYYSQLQRKSSEIDGQKTDEIATEEADRMDENLTEILKIEFKMIQNTVLIHTDEHLA
jgi:hypothetical protein